MEEKTLLLAEFRTMIGQSWTFARLTEDEKERIMTVLSEKDPQTMEILKGTRNQRWNILNSLYHSFLMALDYSWNNWREKNNEEVPF